MIPEEALNKVKELNKTQTVNWEALNQVAKNLTITENARSSFLSPW